MRSGYFLILLVSVVCFNCDGQSKSSSKSTPVSDGKPVTFKNRADSVGYALGNNLGQFLKANGVTDLPKDLNTEMLIKAVRDAIANQPPALSPEQCNEAMNGFVSAKRKESVAKNKAEGAKFLEENKKKPGVITLPSGLQYQVITEGTGPKPVPGDQVQVHYHGTLLDGTVFDSSIERGQPIVHSATGFIKGWNEALSMMGTGSKWKLWVPSDIGYGDQGSGKIQPGQTLTFDIELIKVNP